MTDRGVHVRDQVADAVVAVLQAIPASGGRVYREGAPGWDKETYPTAVVLSGATGIRPISGNDGYRLETRAIRFSVALGVREYDGENPVDELSDLLAAVEDAVVALAEAPWADDVSAVEVAPAAWGEDGHGAVVATGVEFVARVYTMAGDSGAFVAG